MKNIKKILKAGLSLLVYAMLVLPAYALTSTVSDPAGDASPAYLDIVESSVSSRDGKLSFSMVLAGAVPQKPSLPPGAAAIVWSRALDTDPTTFVPNYPFPFEPAVSSPNEFGVQVNWDGTQFSGVLIDKRPLLTGNDPVITAIPFSVRGTKVGASVDLPQIGNPSSFKWITITSIFTGGNCLPLTPMSVCNPTNVDIAPRAELTL